MKMDQIYQIIWIINHNIVLVSLKLLMMLSSKEDKEKERQKKHGNSKNGRRRCKSSKGIGAGIAYFLWYFHNVSDPSKLWLSKQLFLI